MTRTVGALSYVATTDLGALKPISLESTEFGTVRASESSIEYALVHASVNETTHEVDVTLGQAAYPFVGVSYYVLDSHRNGNCTEYSNAVAFVRWVLQMEKALPLISSSIGYAPIPAHIRARSLSLLDTFHCDGVRLTGEDDTASGVDAIVLSFVLVVGVIVLVVAARVASLLLSRYFRARAVKFAPKDATAPVATMIV
eukprot:PhM_4_TR10040/c2_g1_i3/m.99227